MDGTPVPINLAELAHFQNTPEWNGNLTLSYLQPLDDPTDVKTVIEGVIEAEKGAIEHYLRIIEACDGVDWATQDMVIEILRDEENHLRTFERYLAEYA